MWQGLQQQPLCFDAFYHCIFAMSFIWNTWSLIFALEPLAEGEKCITHCKCFVACDWYWHFGWCLSLTWSLTQAILYALQAVSTSCPKHATSYSTRSHGRVHPDELAGSSKINCLKEKLPSQCQYYQSVDSHCLWPQQPVHGDAYLMMWANMFRSFAFLFTVAKSSSQPSSQDCPCGRPSNKLTQFHTITSMKLRDLSLFMPQPASERIQIGRGPLSD